MGVDGKLREVNGRTLAAAALCGLRPDRVAAMIRTQCEPQCIKVRLEVGPNPSPSPSPNPNPNPNSKPKPNPSSNPNPLP